MPELPEVETTRRGILPYVTHKTISRVVVRNGKLRWPVDQKLNEYVSGQPILSLTRRGKYLIFETPRGSIIWHLGMSGSISVIVNHHNQLSQVQTHDHIDLVLDDNTILRYNDPRRFGSVIWTNTNPLEHKLIAHLGPEPLDEVFNGAYLFKQSRNKTKAIKSWLMDSKIVVGVGNIYANESLFLAGIHPLKATGKLPKVKAELLATIIKEVLAKAIEQGGTTLKDFVGADGKPGYFKQQLNVYGRGGLACVTCNKPLTEKKLGGRATVYCTHCQK